MPKRYVVVRAAEAQAAGIPDPPYSTWEEELDNDWDPPTSYLVDTVDKDVIASDGGEPEDQTFTRDWSWVPGALEEAYQCGRDDEFARLYEAARIEHQ